MKLFLLHSVHYTFMDLSGSVSCDAIFLAGLCDCYSSHAATVLTNQFTSPCVSCVQI